jgi:uncharacterized protein (DUF486 family)
MRGLSTILLLICSNAFMTLAWYGHLRFKAMKGFDTLPLLAIVGISWGIALFEYCLMVPANRIGFIDNGGPFSLIQLKIIQEVISLVVFAGFTLLLFRSETFRWNHAAAAVCLILAVWFVFKK